MKTASVIVTALLAVLGCLAGFTNVLPPVAMPYLALSIGVLGALSTRLLPAFVPSFIPAHVEKVLAEIIGTATAVLGAVTSVVHFLPGAPPAMSTWLTVVTAALGALGTALLPHEAPKVVEDKPDAAPAPAPKAASWLIPLLLVGTLGSQACSWAQVKKDVHQIEVTCDTPEVKTLAYKWFMTIVVDLTQQNYGDLLQQLITSLVTGGADLKVAAKAVVCVVEQVAAGTPSEADLAGPVKPSLVPWGFVRVHAHEYLERRAVGGCK